MKARILTITAVALLLATAGCRGGLCGLFGTGAPCGGPQFGPQYNIAPPDACGPDCGCGPHSSYAPGYGYDEGPVGGGVMGADGWDSRSNYGFGGETIVPGTMQTSPSRPLAPVPE